MVNLLILIFFLLIKNYSYANEELEITADQFTYDKDNTRIYATGDVKIIDDQFKLSAQKVFLNNTTNVLSARDDVTIFDTDGSILKAQKIVADQELKNAIIEDNFLYIPSQTFSINKNYLRLAAKRVERRGDYWEKLENGVFTACEICLNEKTNKYEPPLIQLRAKKIIHDKKNLSVKYYDTFVDFKGKSIFYLPYFSHASPLVKRKAGFISPTFLQNHYFGFASDIPYYIPISDYQDLTVIPKFSQKKNPALFIEHRKNFKNGEIFSEFSGTVENQRVNQIKEDRKRGHIKSIGKFDINKNSYLNFKLNRTTDRNYLNTYKYGYTDTLDSFLKLRSHRDLNYYSFESYLFQDLRKNTNQKEIPKILPRIILDLNSEKYLNSFNYETRIELSNLARSVGNETKKLFISQNISLPTILSDGTLINIGAHLNGGIYHIEKFENKKTGKFEHNDFKSSFYPQLTVELTKPFIKTSKNYNTIFKPQLLFLKSIPEAFNREVPDESNVNNFDLDYFDLFNKNRLSGNDRSDNITRFDYGFSFLKQSKNSPTISKIGIAQSYQFDNHKYLPKNSGINDKFSDLLASIEVSPSRAITFNSFFSVNKNNFSIRNAYSNLSFGLNKTSLSINNVHAPAVIDSDGKNIVDSKNQFNLSLEQKFTDFWSFTTTSTFDKKDTIKFHNIEAKVKYEDECLGVSFNWKRKYTHNPEDPTSNSFMFLFSLKEIMENDI